MWSWEEVILNAFDRKIFSPRQTVIAFYVMDEGIGLINHESKLPLKVNCYKSVRWMARFYNVIGQTLLWVPHQTFIRHTLSCQVVE